MSGLLEIGYAAATQSLERQERAVEQLRSRTGVLLAAASVTASFLGAQTIQHSAGLDTLMILALIALVCTIVSCVYVLLPKSRLIFSISGSATFEELYGLSDEEARRYVMYWLDGYWHTNNKIIEELGRWFGAASLALALQLVLWCIALARTIS